MSWSRRLTARGVEGRQSLADHAPVATLFPFNPAVADPDVDRVCIPRRATCQGRPSQSHADGASWMAMPSAGSACLQDMRKMPIAEISTTFAAGSRCTQDTQGDAVASRPSQQEQAAPASTAEPRDWPDWLGAAMAAADSQDMDAGSGGGGVFDSVFGCGVRDGCGGGADGLWDDETVPCSEESCVLNEDSPWDDPVESGGWGGGDGGDCDLGGALQGSSGLVGAGGLDSGDSDERGSGEGLGLDEAFQPLWPAQPNREYGAEPAGGFRV